MAHEAATQSFDNAARALNIDWGTSLDGKQIQRWGEALGRTLIEARHKELKSFQAGCVPDCPENEHQLRELSALAGEPLQTDGPDHPRSVLSNNVGYFQRHRDHTDYPTYRSQGWPIGSGITESGVKLFGKRVKGTEPFWNVQGAEAILALRSTWLSEDEHLTYYWLGRPAKAKAA